MKPEKDKARNYELSNVGQAHISLVWKLFTLEFGFVSIAVNSNNLGCHQKLSEGLRGAFKSNFWKNLGFRPN